MPKVDQLINKYQDYPAHRLIEMLQHKRDYIPEAIEAAQAVLDSRSIQQAEIDEIVIELATSEKKKRQAATKPLSTAEKLLFVFVPLLGLVYLLFAITDAQTKGQSKRISEMVLFSGIGIVLFAVAIWLFS